MPVSTIARPKGRPGYSETMPCAVESAESARGLVRTSLAFWGLETLSDDAALIISELVANSARHTSSRLIRVIVSRRSDSVLLAVVDSSKDPIVRRNALPDDVTGRGLMLVDALSRHWGVTTLPFGKRVWAVLSVESAAMTCIPPER